MPSYPELVEKYRKRSHDTLVDAVAVGLSYADNIAVDLGLIEDTGAVEIAAAAAPFAVIAVTEQMQVILGKKTGRAGWSDAVQRMMKTGAAMGVGALAAALAGPIAAAPAAMGTRALLRHYRSQSLLALRVQDRTARLHALRERREKQLEDGRPALPTGVKYLEEADA